MIGDIEYTSQTSELSGYESGCEDESRREEETRGSLLGQKRLSESDKDLSLAKQGKVVRFGDMCNQHGDYLQSPGIGGSSNVFVNGRPVHRQGDEWSQHASTDPYKPPHTSQSLLEGSDSVFVNGKAIARTGDLISCGAVAEQGSNDVFAAVVLKVNRKIDVAVNKYLKFVWAYLFTAMLLLYRNSFRAILLSKQSTVSY